MNLKTQFAGLAGALTLGLVAVSAQAAPAGSVADLKGAAAQTADVQPATYYYDRRHYRRYHYYPRYHYRYRYHYGPRYHRRHWHYRDW